MINPEFWCGRRVLLTGHTGFKGSWLALWLLEMGAELHGLSLPPDPVSSPGQPLFQALKLDERLKIGKRHQIGDIRNPDAVTAAVAASQPEIVLHLAGQAIVSRSYEDPIGTWSTNVQGTLQLLEALRGIKHPCTVVLITTDKVYANQEWEWGYREDDRLGGHDPYSASKAAMELLISSWRDSFCGTADHQTPQLAIATARAGNVIGGGDWAADRIVPDAMKSLSLRKPIAVRNPLATRPWQHVLEPLAGYLQLAQQLSIKPKCLRHAYNFGPSVESNKKVHQLVEELMLHWPGTNIWKDRSDSSSIHEAALLHLVSDRAKQHLGWRQRWNFSQTAKRTSNWYLKVHEGELALNCCLDDLQAYQEVLNAN